MSGMAEGGAEVKISNLHYDVTEDDLNVILRYINELF